MIFPLACTTSLGDDDDVVAESSSDDGSDLAPLMGDDGGDVADRGCQVVLRDAGRVVAGDGFATVPGRSSWAFDAHVDVSAAALADGWTPRLLVKAGSAGWRSLEPTAMTAISSGTERVLFDIVDGDLPSPGMSGTALSRASVQLIPFLARGEARVFDHNRIADAFANYVLNANNAFALADDAGVCAGPTPSHLRFAADDSVEVDRPLRAGGAVVVDYALERSPRCRAGYAGRPAWNIQAHARFEPMGLTLEASVLDTGASTSSSWVSRPARFEIPAGATSVAFWFHNTDRGGCNEYDSNFGANYVFAIDDDTSGDDTVDDDGADIGPRWLGNSAAVISRAASARCEGAQPFGNTVSFSTWARQRATITDICFEAYEPGFTDVERPDLWQHFDAVVDVQFEGSDRHEEHAIPIVGRVGNNARYAIDLRAFDPFLWGRCLHDVPVHEVSTDGKSLVEATALLRVSVNGHALNTNGDERLRVIYSDDAGAPRVSCP